MSPASIAHVADGQMAVFRQLRASFGLVPVQGRFGLKFYFLGLEFGNDNWLGLLRLFDPILLLDLSSDFIVELIFLVLFKRVVVFRKPSLSHVLLFLLPLSFPIVLLLLRVHLFVANLALRFLLWLAEDLLRPRVSSRNQNFVRSSRNCSCLLLRISSHGLGSR